MNINDSNFIDEARNEAAEWARSLLKRAPSTWLILDTETTGLGSRDEIIQIGAIDGVGNILLDNILIKPTTQITQPAYEIHHISSEMVAGAPSFVEVWPRVFHAIDGKLLVIYNADYDLRMLSQSGRAHDFPISFTFESYSCAMKRYAEWYGDWNDYRGSFRWQRLPSGDHSSLGDCRSVLKLIQIMAHTRPSTSSGRNHE